MPTADPEQTTDQGYGPELERRYFIDVLRPRLGPAALMQLIKSDLPHFSPRALADFEPRQPPTGDLHLGDEFYIRIAGPWNGGVRVTATAPTSFELATLDGHPEAGHIRFEACALDEQPDALRFEIHSRARPRDGLVAFVYDTLGGGKLMQEATWVEFCRRVAVASGGQALGPITIDTTRREPGQPPQQTRHHV